jgi:hypothetical protein
MEDEPWLLQSKDLGGWRGISLANFFLLIGFPDFFVCLFLHRFLRSSYADFPTYFHLGI